MYKIELLRSNTHSISEEGGIVLGRRKRRGSCGLSKGKNAFLGGKHDRLVPSFTEVVPSLWRSCLPSSRRSCLPLPLRPWLPCSSRSCLPLYGTFLYLHRTFRPPLVLIEPAFFVDRTFVLYQRRIFLLHEYCRIVPATTTHIVPSLEDLHRTFAWIACPSFT